MSNISEISAIPAGASVSLLERDLVAILRVDGSTSKKSSWSVPLFALPLALLAGAVTTGVVRNDGWVSATNGVAANREHRTHQADRQAVPSPRDVADVADQVSPSRQAALSPSGAVQIQERVIAPARDRSASAEIALPVPGAVIAEAAEPARAQTVDRAEPQAAPPLLDESGGIRAAAVASEPLRSKASEMSLYEPPQNLALQQESRRKMVDEIRFLRLR